MEVLQRAKMEIKTSGQWDSTNSLKVALTEMNLQDEKG